MTTPTLAAVPALQADQARRTMSGIVAPWGQAGRTSAGVLTLTRGSLALPADLRRVKLVDYHQTPPQAIGYATAAQDTDAGLVMTFQLGTTPAATQALLEASEGLRDAFSVELGEYHADASGLVSAGDLTAVALVPIPAFSNARVTSVAAAHHEGKNTMPDSPDNTPTPAATAAATATVAVTGPVVDTPPAPPAEDTPPDAALASAFFQALRGDTGAAQVLAAAAGAPVPASQPARRPEGFHGPGAAVSGHSPAAVAAAMGRVMRGESSPYVEAALADIVNTDVYTTVGEASYVGQLWNAMSYTRRFVPLLRPGTLTSWKVNGWKWGVRPEVADYAGDKADVPSNEPTVLPASTTAARLAGGHDLDRKFRDFNDTEFIEAYFQAMTESYAAKSDAKALAFILASASTPTGYDGLVATGGTVIDGALLAADLLAGVLDQDVEPDYFLVNRTDRRSTLGGMTELDRPAFIDMWGVDPSKFIGSTSVPAGTVIAGMKGAGTFYELGGSPIRVEAIDIARGGIDEALFGYYATLLHDARGIVKVTGVGPAIP